MDITQIIELLKNNRYMNIENNDIKTCFSKIVDKITSNQKLDEQEEIFFDLYIDYYKWAGVKGKNKVLTEDHERLTQFFMRNPEIMNETAGKFVMVFFYHQMVFDYRIYSDLKFYSEESRTAGFHHLGSANFSVINVNINDIDNDIKNNGMLNVINTVFHELEHARQKMQVLDEDLVDPQAILWAKEYLAWRVIGNMFYMEKSGDEINYQDNFLERDARDYAKKRVLDVKEKYCDANKNYNIASFRLKNAKYDTSVKHIDKENNKEVLAIDLLDAIACEYIKAYPKELLEGMRERLTIPEELRNGFPVLKNIFDEKGNKKNIVQIQYEQEKRRQEKITKNPEKEEEINKLYSTMVAKIAKTDNDLLIQFLCMEADKCKADKDDIGLSSKITQINKIMKDRDILLDEYIENINKRIKELEKESKDTKAANHKEIFNELLNTRSLLSCLVKYNKKFRQQHNEKLIEERYIKEISQQTGVNISDKNMFIGSTDSELDGSVLVEDKSLDDLKMDYREAKKKLEQADLSPEAYKEYKQFMDRKFSDYMEKASQKEREETIELPKRKY